jgi:hypothetical protein
MAINPLVLPNLSTGSFKSLGHTTSRTFADHLGDVVNVKGMGAKGDGTTDDRAAIQAAFDLAFGTAGSPHGNANRFLNRPVFFPAGNYRINAPLYLTNVIGGHIFGAGTQNTKLFYTGSISGNTVVANGISPLIMTNGFAFSRMEGMNLAISGANTTCLYLFQNGAQGQTNADTFNDMLFEGATAGALIGFDANALCSEMIFNACQAIGCPSYGFRNINNNALNNLFIGGGAAQCGIGYSIPTGSVHLYGSSLANNWTDVVCGSNPMIISGARTESANFVTNGADTLVTIQGCIQDNSVSGAGNFLSATLGKTIVDGCVTVGTGATTGKIIGASGTTIYLRGNQFRNTAYLSSFTGTVGQNI